MGRVSAQGLSSITSDSIKEKEDQISQIKKEKETMKNGLSNLKEIKKELEKQKDNLKNYVVQLDSSLEQIERNIADLSGRIEIKEGFGVGDEKGRRPERIHHCLHKINV